MFILGHTVWTCLLGPLACISHPGCQNKKKVFVDVPVSYIWMLYGKRDIWITWNTIKIRVKLAASCMNFNHLDCYYLWDFILNWDRIQLWKISYLQKNTTHRPLCLNTDIDFGQTIGMKCSFIYLFTFFGTGKVHLLMQPISSLFLTSSHKGAWVILMLSLVPS